MICHLAPVGDPEPGEAGGSLKASPSDRSGPMSRGGPSLTPRFPEACASTEADAADRSSPMSRGGRSLSPRLEGGEDENEVSTVDEEGVTVDAAPVGRMSRANGAGAGVPRPSESFGSMRGPAHFSEMRTDGVEWVSV